MKTKIIFISVFIIILSAGTAFLVFLTQKGSLITPAFEAALRPESPSEEKPENPATQPEKEVPQYTTVDTDYFTFTLPSGWEATSEADTLPMTIADSKEAVNEKAQAIDFRTNLSVNRTDLGNNSFKDYIEALKTGLINTIPIIEITKEEKTVLDDREAYFMEIESIQQDLKFNTFVALILGKDNTVWAFSFNTLEESWLKYKGIFYQTIEGLKMK